MGKTFPVRQLALSFLLVLTCGCPGVGLMTIQRQENGYTARPKSSSKALVDVVTKYSGAIVHEPLVFTRAERASDDTD